VIRARIGEWSIRLSSPSCARSDPEGLTKTLSPAINCRAPGLTRKSAIRAYRRSARWAAVIHCWCLDGATVIGVYLFIRHRD